MPSRCNRRQTRRATRSCPRLHVPVTVVLGLAGCKGAAPTTGSEDAPGVRGAEAAPDSTQAQADARDPGDPAGSPTAIEPDDPRGAAELADLSALCAAIDHDYIDGTLSDYYADVEPGTQWGTATMKAGDVADQPGRHLEGAAKELTSATGMAMPAACTKFFPQLDDLE